jgi:hypothetical protein
LISSMEGYIFGAHIWIQEVSNIPSGVSWGTSWDHLWI